MHILYVGYPGFPLGLAQVERQQLIAKGLIAQGCQVTVLNRYGVYRKGAASTLLEQSSFEGVPFVYTSGSPYREDKFFKRNYLKLLGLVNEVHYFLRKKRKNELDAVLITTNSFFNVLLYSVVCALCRVPAVLDNVEYWTSHPVKKSFFKRLDNYLYDNYAFRCVSKVICISNFLVDVVKSHSPAKPVLKIPAIVDFSKFQYKKEHKEPYFLFCGSAAYIEIISFIINAYTLLNQSAFKLYLVASGSDADEEQVKSRIQKSKCKDNIRFFSRLPYDELIRLYTCSSALLIPLRNTDQDKSRFPHKIGEYCASKAAIISTKYGEVGYYFTDQENALLADSYSVEQFSCKMKEVVENPDLVSFLGEQSYIIGRENFCHQMLSKKILAFISGVNSINNSILTRT